MLKSLRENSFESPKFWRVVDGLNLTEQRKLVDIVGGETALKRKVKIKRANATSFDRSMELSTVDYAALLYAAGITTKEVAVRGYQLARVGDRGGYTRRNCRFLTADENRKELESTEVHRKTVRDIGQTYGPDNAKIANDYWSSLKKSDPKTYLEKKRAATDIMHSKLKAIREEDPQRFKDIYKNNGAKKAAEAKARDAKLLSKKLSLKLIRFVDYPSRHWMSRLYTELGLTQNYFRNFLERHPSFVERLRLDE